MKNDKVSTTFAKELFTVISKCGNSIVVENINGRFKRNVTHTKKLIGAESDVDCAEPNVSLRDKTQSQLREKRNAQVPNRFDGFVRY